MRVASLPIFQEDADGLLVGRRVFRAARIDERLGRGTNFSGVVPLVLGLRDAEAACDRMSASNFIGRRYAWPGRYMLDLTRFWLKIHRAS